MELRKLYTRRKTPGGRIHYDEWGVENSWDALGHGSWLIVREDGVSRRKSVEPAYAEVEAAALAADDALRHAIAAAGFPRFERGDAEMKRLWEQFIADVKAHGGRLQYLWPSVAEIAAAGVEAIAAAGRRAQDEEKRSANSAEDSEPIVSYTIADLMAVYDRAYRGTPLEQDIMHEIGRRREAGRLEREQERRGYRRHEAASEP